MTFEKQADIAKSMEPAYSKRIIGAIRSKTEGPTLVVLGGIHGNEPAGHKALQRVFSQLDPMTVRSKGSFFGITGNIQALQEGKRFIDSDLNRIWIREKLEAAKMGSRRMQPAEQKELHALLDCTEAIVRTHTPPFYFIDLHTTSSRTLPFITIDDALINRKFAQCFPVPIIFGMEEYLTGTFLSYQNQKGYLAVGFESGQHDEEAAVIHAEAFIWMVLVHSGFIRQEDVPRFAEYVQLLLEASHGGQRFYEITYRHGLQSGDSFKMFPGFRSFQQVKGGTALGLYNGNTILLKKDDMLFMPLYQKQGEEGYFLIRHVSSWVLVLSELLRRLKLDRIVPVLPGIRSDEAKSGKLIVNLRWTPFLSRKLFHLLGYRHRYIDGNHVVLTNRERVARNRDYKPCEWYKGLFGGK